MGPVYAPYAYAYNPYSNYNVPMYPVATPTVVALRPVDTTPITRENLEAWKALPANDLYGKAIASYWDRDHKAALEMFWILVTSNPEDTRFWYFKALTERALGDQVAAKASAQRGAASNISTRPRPRSSTTCWNASRVGIASSFASLGPRSPASALPRRSFPGRCPNEIPRWWL